jgi:toxin FitB
LIILDTNVISELTRLDPEPKVVSWLDSLSADEVATTAITAAELLYGVARLPDGPRKAALAEAIDGLINEDFRDRMQIFDGLAAQQYAAVVVGREKKGHPISTEDAQIAAICRVHSAELATRNIDDFTDTGIDLINPWNADG